MITDKSKFNILLAKVINVFIYKNDEHDLIITNYQLRITNYELRMHLNTDNTGLFINRYKPLDRLKDRRPIDKTYNI